MRYGLVLFPTMFIERFVNIYLKNKSCAALISKVKCHISDSRSVHRYSDGRKSE